jgi:ribosomal protein S21
MINVEIQRNGNENTAGVMRRFSRKMQSSGVLKRVRSLRYFSRKKSGTKLKKDALVRIDRREKFQDLLKQGRVVETTRRRR